MGLRVKEIVRGGLWSIVRVELSVPRALSVPTTLCVRCGAEVVVVSMDANGTDDTVGCDLLFHSDGLKLASSLVVAHEPSGWTESISLAGVPDRQASGVVEVERADAVVAGSFVDLCATAPGDAIRLRFFGALDLTLDLAAAGRPIWGPSGPIARRFEFKRTRLLQCLRGLDPEFELLWIAVPLVAFLGVSGDSLRELPFPAPRPVEGAIDGVAAEAIRGHFDTNGKRQAFDVFVDDVRYWSGVTEPDGRFSFPPPCPKAGDVGVEVSVAAAYTRAMVSVAVDNAAIELAPEAPWPSGDWTWISPNVLAARKVSVIIPVYNAPTDLDRCLRSVLSNFDGIARLIVIDDCSPDGRVLDVLSALRGSRMEVFRNPENLGFTRTVNRGIELAGGDDVILLNSDTIVPSRWVDGLKAAAYSGPWVATATPISNNAGAFSVPEFGVANALPGDLSVEGCARLYREVSVGAYPKVPTGNGFCMYVRRDCFDAVGTFDEVAFPVGYGEENDLCMRAVRAGFEHVVDDRTFVFHARSASFGHAKTSHYAAGRAVVRERYPEYDELISVFSDGAAMLGVRWRIREAILRYRAAARPPGKCLTLAVSSEL